MAGPAIRKARGERPLPEASREAGASRSGREVGITFPA
jgi:hypothetical protein